MIQLWVFPAGKGLRPVVSFEKKIEYLKLTPNSHIYLQFFPGHAGERVASFISLNSPELGRQCGRL